MNEERRNKIVDDHPLLFKHRTYFACGDGWLDIIERLADQIEPMLQKVDKDDILIPSCADVKEKYGGLRFYMYFETKEMDELIYNAEKESRVTCEVSGMSGTMNNGPWYQTLCTEHMK